MICKGCIARQRKLVEFFCRKGEGSMCLKARARLAKMGGEALETVPSQDYQTRMMSAEPVAAAVPIQYTRSEPVEEAPYGYKLDGTPRQRPGRAPKAE